MPLKAPEVIPSRAGQFDLVEVVVDPTSGWIEPAPRLWANIPNQSASQHRLEHRGVMASALDPHLQLGARAVSAVAHGDLGDEDGLVKG